LKPDPSRTLKKDGTTRVSGGREECRRTHPIRGHCGDDQLGPKTKVSDRCRKNGEGEKFISWTNLIYKNAEEK